MNEQMVALIRKHCATLRDEFSEAEARFQTLGTGAPPEQISLLRAQAHKIKGSSGTLGFAEISRRAEVYEHSLRSLETQCLQRDDLAALHRMHNDLGQTIAQIAPEQSTLFQRLQSGALQ